MSNKAKPIGPFGFQSHVIRRLTREYGTPNDNGTKKSPISQSVLSYILQGKRAPTPKQAEMLEKVLHDLGYAISKFDMVFAFKPGQPLLSLDRTHNFGGDNE